MQLKKCLSTPSATYCWRRLSYGLQGGGQIFQLLMSQIMAGLNFKSLIVYIDDILVYSPTFEQHCKDLQEVFSRLRHANLRLHPKKCNFAKKSTIYLGHRISADGI